MIKSILIPTDGSPNSRISLDYGIYIASLFNAVITGLNVIDIRALEGPFLSDISGSLGFSPFQNYLPKFQQTLEERGDLMLEDFKNYCSEKSVQPKIKRLTGIIPNIIANEAKRVDLIIIAQRGEHEKWSTGLLGSTTESVVRKSPRPVLVTPNSFRTFENVLIAYDGSVESNRALKTACELFTVIKSNVKIVFVTDDEERSGELTGEVEEFVSPYKIKVEIEWLQGEAGKKILDYAENNHIDLIVMGAFGHSRIHDLILGGTTAYIIRKSTIPILLNR
jgi:nucleotide-binding universal stress UspA family protein